MKKVIFTLLLSIIYCNVSQEMMDYFVLCAIKQIGKEYSEDGDNRGPSVFSNRGLIWYCRDYAGFPKISTIYLSWKKVANPKIGAYVYGITKDNGASVSADNLGIIIAVEPTVVVAGDEDKGILTRQLLNPKKKYLRLEYIYADI